MRCLDAAVVQLWHVYVLLVYVWIWICTYVRICMSLYMHTSIYVCIYYIMPVL